LPRKLGLFAASILALSVLTPAPAVLAAAGTARPSTAAARTCTTWVTTASRNVGTGDNQLEAVTAVSSRDVWAVGQYFVGANTNTLIEHWNGTAWKVVSSPSPGSVNSLNAIYAASASNIWAVGGYASGASASHTLIEHWNGQTWKVVKSPNAGSLTNALSGVRGTSARDVWAVGYTEIAYPRFNTLVLHWNGTAWKVVKSANGDNQSNQLTAVRPLSATDAWAAGWYTKGSTNRSLIEHWSKGRWRVVRSPNGSNSTNELMGVLATSATSAWATGWDYNPAIHADRTLLLHWNGKAWKHAFSPNTGAGSNDLYAIGGTSAANIYAVGTYLTAVGGKVLILHWNGRHWRVMAGRNPNENNSFSAVFALSPGSIWAVGSTSTSSTTRTLIEHCR
jgi:hypothetical protein